MFKILLILATFSISAAVCAMAPPPAAPVRPVTDDYYGTKVVDNYRWMETPDNPELTSWMKAQNDYTRAILESIPGRKALLERITTLDNTGIYVFYIIRRGERYFYEKLAPGELLPRLYYRDGLQGTEHLLLDPATLSKGSTHYALDYYMPSWDGRYVAYGVSAGGSEQDTLHILDVEGTKSFAEAIDRTSDNIIAWRPDNRSFFYLRYSKPTANTPPSQTEYNARTYLHTLGTRTDGDGDPVVFGRGVSKHVNVPEGQITYILLSPNSPYAIAVANRNADNSPSALFVAPLAKINGPNTPWHKLANFEDGITAFHQRRDTLYFLSLKSASRSRLLSTSLVHPDVTRAQVVVPESQGVLTNFHIAKDGLYVRERDGVVSHLLWVSWNGKQTRLIPTPFEGTVYGNGTDPGTPGTLFDLQGWTQAPRIFSYNPVSNTSSDTGLVSVPDVGMSQLEAKEVFAVSYDGTRIPLSIIYKKGIKLDGSHPTILNGYGSYGITEQPYYDPTRLAWAEHSGIYAIAHVRGGGEYGEDWHKAGQKLTKINTILDFIACAQYLVDQHYTSPRYLAGEGGSAGGITVGGALTWRPDLFAVILDEVGMSDALRSETTPNGPPNVPEFGSVKTEAGFHGLYAMSAYAHVHDGTPYPAVLFTTGANDPRVAPWEVTKMAARTQAATSSGKPVLLRVDYDAGHGIGSTRSQYDALLADKWAFTLWQTGDPAFQPVKKP